MKAEADDWVNLKRRGKSGLKVSKENSDSLVSQINQDKVDAFIIYGGTEIAQLEKSHQTKRAMGTSIPN